jgi:hypothetical protein
MMQSLNKTQVCLAAWQFLQHKPRSSMFDIS